MITRPAILERVIGPTQGDLGAEVAEYLLGLDFPAEDRGRYTQLAAKAREDALTPQEQAELDDYLSVNSFLTIVQSKARASLRNRGLVP